LTKGYYTLIDDEFFDNLVVHKWHVSISKDNLTRIYAARHKGNEYIRMHRIIMEIHLGRELLKNEYIDHIDHDGLNNRLSNLRFVTTSQNAMNARKPGGNRSSIYKGVYWKKDRKKWRAQITFESKRIHLGYFEKESDAALAYNYKAVELFGSNACINNISES
jgi:hypothetical protein